MSKNKISPHVSIYKFPITAVSSISNRVTGLFCSSLFIAVGMSNFSNIDIKQKYKELKYTEKKIVNYSILFPSTYHMLGGIRHIVWDKYPKMLTNKQVSTSSTLLFGSSILLTYTFESIFNLLSDI